MPYIRPQPGDDDIARLYNLGLTNSAIARALNLREGNLASRLCRMRIDGEVQTRMPKGIGFGEALRRQRLAGERARFLDKAPVEGIAA